MPEQISLIESLRGMHSSCPQLNDQFVWTWLVCRFTPGSPPDLMHDVKVTGLTGSLRAHRLTSCDDTASFTLASLSFSLDWIRSRDGNMSYLILLL